MDSKDIHNGKVSMQITTGASKCQNDVNATYMAKDSNQNWIDGWNNKKDDIQVENYCSYSNNVVQFRAGKSNQPVGDHQLRIHSGSI